MAHAYTAALIAKRRFNAPPVTYNFYNTDPGSVTAPPGATFSSSILSFNTQFLRKYKYVDFTIVGGGGGGGGGADTDGNNSGGGGGGSGYRVTQSNIQIFNPFPSRIQIDIGGGGGGGTTYLKPGLFGGNGGNGAPTILYIKDASEQNINQYVATGGYGGTGANDIGGDYGNGGAGYYGGGGGGGKYNTGGGAGSSGFGGGGGEPRFSGGGGYNIPPGSYGRGAISTGPADSAGGGGGGEQGGDGAATDNTVKRPATAGLAFTGSGGGGGAHIGDKDAYYNGAAGGSGYVTITFHN
jgi:fibronectin-binding autotransporter adhesin